MSENTPHILVGTPCYGGMCHEGYMHSLITSVVALPQLDISISIKTIVNESLITRARNHIADSFLENKIFTHLLFIDSDISFSYENIARMVKFNKEFVVGSYPHKAYDWTQIHNLIKHKPDISTSEIEASILRYSGSMMADRNNTNEEYSVKEDNGFVKGWWDCPTGFMLIRRDVFEKMINTIGDEIMYINDLPQTSDDGLSVIVNEKKQYAFFNAEVDPQTKRYLSEDYLFCKRWITRCDGEIWLDSRSKLTHTGTWSFKGDLFTFIKNNSFKINPISEKVGQLVGDKFK